MSSRPAQPWSFRPLTEDTRQLVQASALRRLEAFGNVAALLANESKLVRARHQAVHTVAQLKEESDEQFYRRLGSPIFRGWLNAFGRVGEWSLENPLLRQQLDLWPAMLFDLSETGAAEMEMSVIDGWWLTWDPRVAIRLPGRERIRVQKEGCAVRFLDPSDGRLVTSAEVTPDGLLRLSESSLPDAYAPIPFQLPNTAIAVRNDIPLLHLRLREGEVPTRDRGIVAGELDHRRTTYGAFDPTPFGHAARLVARVWPEEFDDWQETLQVVVPRTAPSGWTVGGFTVSSHQGACWVIARDPLTILETLVHEQSHVKLRYIEESTPLLAAEQAGDLFQVGWRTDPRPIVGIYEGVYVHLHCAEVLRRLLDANALEAHSRKAALRLRQLVRQVAEAVDILRQHGRFTETGEVFLDWAEREVHAVARI